MSDAIKKNFEIVRTVMNDQAKTILDLQDRISLLEGNIANLAADIANTKQLLGHLHGRGTGSTVHN